MPEEETVKKAKQDAREGKAPSSQAGEFVREEMEHVRQGKHGARSPQQAIAIGLSKARRAGVKLPPPRAGKTSKRTRAHAARDYKKGQRHRRRATSRTRSRGISSALKREGRQAASQGALSTHARSSARKRRSASRHQAAERAVRTKGSSGLKRAARKAALTRRSHRS
jgi:hypothetical protein